MQISSILILKIKWQIQDLNLSLSSSRALEFCWGLTAGHVIKGDFIVTQRDCILARFEVAMQFRI